MVDLGGYVIILVETNDKRVKHYGNFISQYLHIPRQDMMMFDCFDIQVLRLIRQIWKWRMRYWKLMEKLYTIAPIQKSSRIYTT